MSDVYVSLVSARKRGAEVLLRRVDRARTLLPAEKAEGVDHLLAMACDSLRSAQGYLEDAESRLRDSETDSLPRRHFIDGVGGERIEVTTITGEQPE